MNEKQAAEQRLGSDAVPESVEASTRKRGPPDKIPYPKKRVNVACELCRSRKTKCNAARPECSFCKEIGAECLYRKVDAGDCQANATRKRVVSRPASTAAASQSDTNGCDNITETHDASPASPTTKQREHEIIARLSRIEELLQNRDAPLSVDMADTLLAAKSTPVHTIDTFTGFRQAGIVIAIGFDLSGFSTLSGQPCPVELEPLCRSSHEEDLEEELLRGEALFDGPPPDIQQLDLTARRCWKLLDAFSRDVLPWCPIMDPESCSEFVSLAINEGFEERDLATSLTLLIFALGSFTPSSGPDSLPGLEYFQVATNLLGTCRISQYDIRVIQCNMLMAFYLLYALRPVQAYEFIQIAATKVVFLLRLHGRLDADPTLRELVHRAYWACYIIEHELQVVIPFSSWILQELHEQVPLPTSYYEEPGIYWFSAEIALRRIFVRPRNGVGWQMITIYEPSVCDELSTQLKQWHENLPPPIAFPLEDPHQTSVLLRPLLDPRKIFLRTQFYSFQCTILWPNVLQLLSIPQPPRYACAGPIGSPSASLYNPSPATIELATRSMRYAVLYIYGVESLLHSRSIFLQSKLVGLYAMTMLLACANSSFRLRDLGVVQSNAAEAIRVAWRAMSMWGGNATVKARVKRLEDVMHNTGVSLQ